MILKKAFATLFSQERTNKRDTIEDMDFICPESRFIIPVQVFF